jgi:hypothetical protein
VLRDLFVAHLDIAHHSSDNPVAQQVATRLGPKALLGVAGALHVFAAFLVRGEAPAEFANVGLDVRLGSGDGQKACLLGHQRVLDHAAQHRFLDALFDAWAKLLALPAMAIDFATEFGVESCP